MLYLLLYNLSPRNRYNYLRKDSYITVANIRKTQMIVTTRTSTYPLRWGICQVVGGMRKISRSPMNVW